MHAVLFLFYTAGKRWSQWGKRPHFVFSDSTCNKLHCLRVTCAIYAIVLSYCVQQILSSRRNYPCICLVWKLETTMNPSKQFQCQDRTFLTKLAYSAIFLFGHMYISTKLLYGRTPQQRKGHHWFLTSIMHSLVYYLQTHCKSKISYNSVVIWNLKFIQCACKH